MKKIFILLALAFVLASCDDGDMETRAYDGFDEIAESFNADNPFLGTWEQWVWRENGNVLSGRMQVFNGETVSLYEVGYAPESKLPNQSTGTWEDEPRVIATYTYADNILTIRPVSIKPGSPGHRDEYQIPYDFAKNKLLDFEGYYYDLVGRYDPVGMDSNILAAEIGLPKDSLKSKKASLKTSYP